MRFAILVMTDGRGEILQQCLDRNLFYAVGEIEYWLHDDTGDDVYRRTLATRYPLFTQIGAGPRRGFGGAIRWAWSQLAQRSTADYVWHQEDDFLADSTINLTEMAEVLESCPYLAQMALKRQPWGPAEGAAGGFMAMHPEAYTDMFEGGLDWLEHRLFWTTNPSLYRRSLCSLGWPIGARSETTFGARLMLDGTPEVPGDQIRFGYWGRRDDPPAVQHIGMQRVGRGY